MDTTTTPFAKNYLFQGLSPSESDTLAALLIPKTVPEGKAVFLENMPGEALYIIHKGSVRIARMLVSGQEKTLVVLGEDDIFGEMAIFDEGGRTVSAFVAADVELFCLHKSDFENLCNEFPVLALKLSLNMIKLFSRRARESQSDYDKLLRWCYGKGLLPEA